MDILDHSCHQLGLLKEQIEPLVEFYKIILGEIENTVEDLENLLRPITMRIKLGANSDEVEGIRLSRSSKRVSYDCKATVKSPTDSDLVDNPYWCFSYSRSLLRNRRYFNNLCANFRPLHQAHYQ